MRKPRSMRGLEDFGRTRLSPISSCAISSMRRSQIFTAFPISPITQISPLAVACTSARSSWNRCNENLGDWPSDQAIAQPLSLNLVMLAAMERASRGTLPITFGICVTLKEK